MLYDPFDEDQSPLRVTPEIDEQLLPRVKILYDIIRYLNMLKDRQPLKLTPKGNLPRNFCRELYDLGVKDEELLAMSSHPINVELDSIYIHVLNLFTKMLGLTRKRQGKLSLTKKAIDRLTMQSTGDFFREVFLAYTKEFNWAYSDGYPESWIIQAGFGFSIFLVQKYGDQSRSVDFYSEKYLQAFPAGLTDFLDTAYSTKEGLFKGAYGLRVFKRFLKRFGFVEISGDAIGGKDFTVKKTPVIDQIAKWNIR